MVGRTYVSYTRCSTEKQQASGLGLEAQQCAVRRFLAPDDQIVAEFVEVESGRRSDRPQLAAAIAAARGCRGTLLIARLDRLSRSVAFVSTLMESGVDFVAVDNPTASRSTIHILAAVAEEEARAISARTRAALAAARARGVRLGNPNGARALRGLGNAAAISAVRARADERARSIVPTILALRQEGVVSFGAIANALNNARIVSARGGAWHPTSVRNLMRRVCVLDARIESDHLGAGDAGSRMGTRFT